MAIVALVVFNTDNFVVHCLEKQTKGFYLSSSRPSTLYMTDDESSNCTNFVTSQQRGKEKEKQMAP